MLAQQRLRCNRKSRSRVVRKNDVLRSLFRVLLRPIEHKTASATLSAVLPRRRYKCPVYPAKIARMNSGRMNRYVMKPLPDGYLKKKLPLKTSSAASRCAMRRIAHWRNTLSMKYVRVNWNTDGEGARGSVQSPQPLTCEFYKPA